MFLAHPLSKDLIMRLNPRAGLLAHYFTNADPMIEFLRRNNRKNFDPRPGVLRPPQKSLSILYDPSLATPLECETLRG